MVWELTDVCTCAAEGATGALLQRLMDILLQCADADLVSQEPQLDTVKQDVHDQEQADGDEHHHVVPVLGCLICLARLMEENAQVSHSDEIIMC
jgi:hypothetical protein